MRKKVTKRKGDICNLSELSVGSRVKIEQMKISNKILQRRLFEMGVTIGTTVEIKKISPLGDPVGIALRGYELCSRKSELKNIFGRVI